MLQPAGVCVCVLGKHVGWSLRNIGPRNAEPALAAAPPVTARLGSTCSIMSAHIHTQISARQYLSFYDLLNATCVILILVHLADNTHPERRASFLPEAATYTGKECH